MRVQWLNERLTEAIVVRGFLWWRKEACVKWLKKTESTVWPDDWGYLPSGVRCAVKLEYSLDKARKKEVTRVFQQTQRSNWHSKVKLTPAWDVSSRQTAKPVDKKPGAR